MASTQRATIVPIYEARFTEHNPRRLPQLIDQFCLRYSNPKTRRNVEYHLHSLFSASCRNWPDELDEEDVIQWATADSPANNTLRQRLSSARVFLDWCRDRGIAVPRLTALPSLRKQYPRTYGRVQAPTPARFLTASEAYDRLIPACQDHTWRGSRDQLLIRLGLTGLRASEIASLRHGDRQGDQLHWIGKGRRPRTATLSQALTELLDRWDRHYSHELARPLTDQDPLICGDYQTCAGDYDISWGDPLSYHTVLSRVTTRAKLAGLGHVAPHDLRRTAASILHNATDPSGAHQFDLLDVQRVLGHADPTTTMKSYIAPIDRTTLDKAARFIG